MSAFDLTALIRREIEAGTEADPAVIARRLLLKMSAEDCRLALSACLPGHVRVHIGRERMAARKADDTEAPRPGESRRRRALSELDLSVCVANEWKMLGDCTADDLDTLAAYHDDQASRHKAVRDRYARYAALVRDRQCATLRDVFRQANGGELAA